ncbi:MAG: family 43 glycosylhydrolase [Lachnospiraceae bacterium]|jgi:hypothetical protein|nr:family 43 glycosylhydrolase [Lachnospiraceae bacterium]MCH4031819.1 family 43 glycosylhydrolase [Lachnospiraceae bacterium]MCH4070443.1 family 43 glycosylhydrolase [Lachnospiraceae bacterium]MCH4109110.1 family 43 glycosylhydrolase [Lachnospiraceae bacterium]MCI1302945.1 family 43 glycosylhydrolase [Lachnospiraceae bacterium]
MKYSLDMTLRQLGEDEGACNIFDRFIPGMREMMSKNPAASELALRKLLAWAGGRIPAEAIKKLDEALIKYGKTAGFTPTEKARMAQYQQIAEADKKHREQKAAKPGIASQDAIYPGKPWLDTKGERIQAHGGALHCENGVYYWYGENKEHTDGKSSIWTWGIRLYRSKDLYNWEDLGLLIPPVLDNPNSSLFPDRRVDRPHIRRCAATGKYVAWIKLSGEDASFLIMQADSFLGPYKIVREDYRPGGFKAGDFDIAQDDKSGKSYLFMDADHKGVYTFEMAEDMLSVEKKAAEQYVGLFPPFTREGITVFEHEGGKYMLSSGMTGYIPNQSDSALSFSWKDAFIPKGDPYVDDTDMTSFNSQFTQVFKLPDRDQYIALSDRWVPGYPVDRKRADLLRRVIASRYDARHYQATEEEKKELATAPMLETADTSIADYVWLPVEFDGCHVRIRWRDKWTV